jgi:hypothetical protein
MEARTDMQRKTVLFVAILASIISTRTYANPVACGFQDYEVDDIYSGDRQAMNMWGCSQAAVNAYWAGIRTGDFWQRWWYYGFNDVCNTKQALGRTMNAMFFLATAQNYSYYNCAMYNTPDCKVGPLSTGYSYATARNNRVWPSCATDAAATTHQYWFLGPPPDLELKKPFFFSASVSQRAAMLYHEARHIDGKSHVDCRRGPGGCDESWGYNGGYNFETRWNWEFYDSATSGLWAPAAMRNSSGRYAQALADSAFRSPISIFIYHGDYR